jgi:hypothetical protein
MSSKFRTQISFASVLVLLVAGTAMPSEATGDSSGISPALCGPDDIPEPGIQGEVPLGATPNYNCGVKLIGSLPGGGAVQGNGMCAYRRSPGNRIDVIDVSDPTAPVLLHSVPYTTPPGGGSETMRAVVASDRAVLVQGKSVFDISDCLNPVFKGDINWPNVRLNIPFATSLLPHDLRISPDGRTVYASFGLWEVDISNLDDPTTWTLTDHRCDLAAQIPGPWKELHRQTIDAGLDLCTDQAKPAGIPTFGAGHTLGISLLHGAVLWPSVSHTIGVRGNGTRVYLGDQAGGTQAAFAPEPTTQIVDVTQDPPKILGRVNGPGHGLDWFRDRFGREYVLQSNEGGTNGIAGFPGGDTCAPYPRTTRLSWGFEVIVSDVTFPPFARNVSMLTIAINRPEWCDVRQASGNDPWIAQTMVDNPNNAKFAAVNFGQGATFGAGLRIFDIRNPRIPREVAYFNHGNLNHAGASYYDAARKLLYVPGGNAFWVLQIEPQVVQRLGL